MKRLEKKVIVITGATKGVGRAFAKAAAAEGAIIVGGGRDEEAGIEISYEEISDVFYEVRHYIKNYFNSGKNTIAIIHYYIIKTDKEPNLNKINLTSQEKGYAFEIKSVPISSFETFLGKYLNNEKEINRIIANETLEAFKKLPQNLKVN